MRLPESTFFVDGNPLGGTIVRAAVMNGFLGELSALLALEGIAPLETGELPEDHRQIADMLAAGWVRIRQTGAYPEAAATNSILLDPLLLLAGNWPFKIYRDGSWQDTEFSSADPAEGEDGDEPPQFSDVQHGQRGGGNLHVPASEAQSGFLTAEGFQALVALAQSRPRVYRSDWTPVVPGQVISFVHSLEANPDIIQVKFRASPGSTAAIAQAGLNTEFQPCGPTIDQLTNSTIRIVVGDFAWWGLTPTGSQSIAAGEYQVIALVHGI